VLYLRPPTGRTRGPWARAPVLLLILVYFVSNLSHDSVRLVLEATALQRHGAEVTAPGPSVVVAHEPINEVG
jgi:hypothetical protein